MTEQITEKIKHPEINQLLETVIEGGYCVGCGACASVSGSPLKMELDADKKLQASIDTLSKPAFSSHSILSVCPFSSQSLNEDQISQEVFHNDCKYHHQIGYYLDTYAGYVAEDDYRDRGSSGGMGTWIVTNLLSQGLVDGVIHIHQRHPSPTDPRLFHYQISTTIEQVRNGAKSRYYPVEMSEVMQLIREQPGRYAIVGIPCFIKAVRLLMRQDQLLAERIRFCVGLICGHLKSMRFAEMLAWQCGIEPGNLLAIDFRKKLPDANANRYGVEVTGLQAGKIVTHVSPVYDLYGTDWGLGFFKYKACDYCDDVVAETADVTVGDAWLPQYVKDSQGTNVVIVRHPVIQDMIERAMTAGTLQMDRISADEVAQSQKSGFQHRREGLAYRLYLTEQRGDWYPQKRVKPSASHLNKNLQARQIMRVALAAQSHLACKNAVDAGQFSVFKQQLDPLVQKYKQLYQVSLWKRVARRIKRLLVNLLGTFKRG
ncbi:Coenzyme F420 hydrogenase/dehydrogenase, beta subunit C-terminal domain [Anabaena sp. UHCC 0399]|uniref:Coenzyme F420 hydrogenase/dehydrogenase, beta subunit C-terminal domain n=1 Tax=Anabaena sp. UHCC 0399 TaxID=3110238 RepID=UPI002B1F18A9|nr:Coenzyme F420 hydrogenase/dehydrogenase, beta subunit C-terminal domain [Anabaena sp. UHCC 0399]MEA5564730.1 Coenzyme F420 hydrogenase/dehydrogenase, beta subunit C-terminal domain [Anabaena sp. UHCC 0399]